MTGKVDMKALIRRGSGTLSAETLRYLAENEAKLSEICADINARIEAFRDIQLAAQERIEAAGAKERALEEREAALIEQRDGVGRREADVGQCRAILSRLADQLDRFETNATVN